MASESDSPLQQSDEETDETLSLSPPKRAWGRGRPRSRTGVRRGRIASVSRGRGETRTGRQSRGRGRSQGQNRADEAITALQRQEKKQRIKSDNPLQQSDEETDETLSLSPPKRAWGRGRPRSRTGVRRGRIASVSRGRGETRTGRQSRGRGRSQGQNRADEAITALQRQEKKQRIKDMELLVLDEDVLAIARMQRQDILALPDDEDNMKGNRHTAYRQFVLWQHGRHGSGVRMIVPSCCVWRIRDKFPDVFEQYTGFKATRLKG